MAVRVSDARRRIGFISIPELKSIPCERCRVKNERAGVARSTHRNSTQRREKKGTRKRSCATTVFLQLSNYEQARPNRGCPIGRPLCRIGCRAQAADHSIAAFRPPDGNECRGDTGRVGNSCIYPVASPGKAKTGGPGHGAPGWNIFVVFSEHRGAAGSVGLFV